MRFITDDMHIKIIKMLLMSALQKKQQNQVVSWHLVLSCVNFKRVKNSCVTWYSSSSSVVWWQLDIWGRVLESVLGLRHVLRPSC